MVEEKRDPKEIEDIDERLREASQVLIAEMDKLIRRAKILQAEHRAIVAERRKNKKLDEP